MNRQICLSVSLCEKFFIEQEKYSVAGESGANLFA